MWTKYGLNRYICSMPTIKFFLQSEKNPSGIYVRLRDGRTLDAKAKTKFAVNPSDWSAKKGTLKHTKDEAFLELDEKLKDFSNRLLKHYNKAVGVDEINSTWLKEFINPSEKSDSIPKYLTEYFEYYKKFKMGDLRASTITKLKGNKALIERFQKSIDKRYLIKEVSPDFKLAFETYCLENKYAKNTIARALRFIKTICRHARIKGVDTHSELDAIKPKNVKVEKVFLSEIEIEQILKKELPTESLDNARDWLILSCETAQRISDFLKFKKENIRNVKLEIKRKTNLVPLLEFRQVKTDKLIAIPLSKRAMGILNKREGEFPRKISAAKYNEYIKKVCELAGLTEKIKGSKIDKETNRKETGIFPKFELITAHIGRRSFANNYYGKIPTALLMSATGHTTEKMFLEYIGKTQTESAMQLAEYIN